MRLRGNDHRIIVGLAAVVIVGILPFACAREFASDAHDSVDAAEAAVDAPAVDDAAKDAPNDAGRCEGGRPPLPPNQGFGGRCPDSQCTGHTACCVRADGTRTCLPVIGGPSPYEECRSDGGAQPGFSCLSASECGDASRCCVEEAGTACRAECAPNGRVRCELDEECGPGEVCLQNGDVWECQACP